MNVKLNKDQKIKILNSDAMYEVMRQILLRQNALRRNQEYFWVAGLDKKSNLLFVELLGIGADNRVSVEVPEIFRIGIYKLASHLILIHNHPQGYIAPSDADLRLTEKILKAGKLINIEVADHLIISETKYFSMAISGDIEKFQNSKNFEMVADLELEMKELRERSKLEGKIQGKREAKIQIAKRLLKMGTISNEDIRKISGLSAAEFNQLLKLKD